MRALKRVSDEADMLEPSHVDRDVIVVHCTRGSGEPDCISPAVRNTESVCLLTLISKLQASTHTRTITVFRDNPVFTSAGLSREIRPLARVDSGHALHYTHCKRVRNPCPTNMLRRFKYDSHKDFVSV